jgi:hypothetical protein
VNADLLSRARQQAVANIFPHTRAASTAGAKRKTLERGLPSFERFLS